MASLAAAILTHTSTGEVGGAWGSSGATTKKFHGATAVSMTIVEAVEAVPAVGWYGPGPVADNVSQMGEGSIEGKATYTDLPMILNGLFTYTSGSTGNSTGGTTAPYYYAWAAPKTSTQVCATYTMEYGASTALTYASIGSVLNGISLKGEAGGLWDFSVPFVSKIVKPIATASTAGNIDRTVHPIAMKDTQFYWDAFSSGTMGSTALSGTLISFSLDVDAKRHTKLFAGSKFPGNWGDNRMEGTLSAIVEFNSTMKALLDTICGATSGTALEAQIRIQAVNTTATDSTSRRSAAINFAGIQSNPIKLWDDRDGNLTIALQMAGKYSTALTNWLTFVVENGSSSTT
ncbi:MAG: hypothetical protein KJ888_20870 [Gammaproteobacteria bacterium]|nr:hypothetical protein [Gammaproteobacteria bacterium]